MDEIMWQDPPADKRTSANTPVREFVKELQKHPGKWALFRAGAPHASTGQHIRTQYKAEVTVRKQDDGSWDIYARWPEDAS